ncbi:MAG: DUF397 domain-containing protein [Pseudonocardia sp.]
MPAPDPNTTYWRKSSFSTDQANCVEVAFLDAAVAVRHSKHPTDAALAVTPKAWTAFTTAIRNGEFV